jgi:hypothetical protein
MLSNFNFLKSNSFFDMDSCNCKFSTKTDDGYKYKVSLSVDGMYEFIAKVNSDNQMEIEGIVSCSDDDSVMIYIKAFLTELNALKQLVDVSKCVITLKDGDALESYDVLPIESNKYELRGLNCNSSFIFDIDTSKLTIINDKNDMKQEDNTNECDKVNNDITNNDKNNNRWDEYNENLISTDEFDVFDDFDCDRKCECCSCMNGNYEACDCDSLGEIIDLSHYDEKDYASTIMKSVKNCNLIKCDLMLDNLRDALINGMYCISKDHITVDMFSLLDYINSNDERLLIIEDCIDGKYHDEIKHFIESASKRFGFSKGTYERSEFNDIVINLYF